MLYVALPSTLTPGPTWVVPALEVALLAPLIVTRPHRSLYQSRRRRRLSVALVALLGGANATSLGLLVHSILSGSGLIDGRPLILSALVIWSTNVVVFGLWFWELDGGGPAARCGQLPRQAADFAFPQSIQTDLAPVGWRPAFMDYLFVSFTNATAFSPTDTMPLTRRAKGLMMLEAAVSVLVVVLVAGRAVNVL